MKMKARKAPQSATVVYKKRLAIINERIEVLKILVAKHAESQAKDKANWGLVGDLDRLSHLLDESCSSVGG